MLWVSVLVLVGYLLETVLTFDWVSQPGTVRVCLYGDAVFPWQYDPKQYPDVDDSVYWKYMGTIGDLKEPMILEKQKGIPMTYEAYAGRADVIKASDINAGFVLRDVTEADTGTYKVLLVGYADGEDTADLIVYTEADLQPQLQVNNMGQTLDSRVNISDMDQVTLTVTTQDSLPADVTIIVAGNITTHCTNSTTCSKIIRRVDHKVPDFNVTFIMNYHFCPSQSYAVMVLTGWPGPEAGVALWLVIVITLLIAVVVVVCIMGIAWLVLHHKQTSGQTLKPHEKKYVDLPMTTLCRSGKAMDRDMRDEPVGQSTNQNSNKTPPGEHSPLVDKKNNSTLPGSTEPPKHTLFVNLAKAKGLSDDTINALLEEDFDAEEALATMEDEYVGDITSVPDQQAKLRAWVHELTRPTDLSTSQTTDQSSSPGSSGSDFNLEDCLRNLQLGEKNEREIREYVLKNGVLGLESLLRDKLNCYMKSPVNIAVTGRSGTGKSSLINTLRGLRAKDKGAAKVGVVETTFQMTPYYHPDLDNVIFWDLPGVNTPNFPRASYLDDVEFKRYDAFIIACTERLTEDDMWLATAASQLTTPFYFLRTKIDVDVANNKRDGGGNEKTLLASIRAQIETNLARQGLPGDRVFLISGILKHKTKWDFPKLVRDLVQRTPERNKSAMIMAMVSCSREIISMKKDDLASRIGTVALTAGLSQGRHEHIIREEVILYTDCFGVKEDDLKNIEIDKLDKRLKDIHSMLDAILKEPVEESTKGRDIGKWIFGIGYFVGKVIDDVITKNRQVEAMKRQEHVTSATDQIAKDAIVEEAVFILQTVLVKCEQLAMAVLEQREFV